MNSDCRQHRVSTTVERVQQQTYNVGVQSVSKRRYGEDIVPVSGVIHDSTTLKKVSGKAPNDFVRPYVNLLTKHNRYEASKIENANNAVVHGPTLYTQRKTAALTQKASQNPLLSLDHALYDLPNTLVHNFFSLGIKSIYPWQSSCLLGRGLLTGKKNLVYTAPTGGGKSLVADVLMLKRVIENKKAILVLPYVALVQEKLRWLRRAVEGVKKRIEVSHSNQQLGLYSANEHCSIRVVGFFGGSKVRASWCDVDIAVCTVEKANALVNTAIEDGSINELGIVVLDELHMIDDDNRGYLIELMATKLLSMQHATQIVGMSATLSNTETLAKWLDAKYYESKYRPIPVDEYLVCDNAIYSVSTSSALFGTASQLTMPQAATAEAPQKMIRTSNHEQLKRPIANAVVALTMETVRAGYAALVFCASRLSCQTTATLISGAMPPYEDLDTATLDRRKDILSSLRSLSVGLDDILEKTVVQGVAFHHAGLTTEERDIIAEAYDQGVLKVIVATCSLAAGINLPARRVILHGARMGRDIVGPAMLRQMRGRAGRKGKDEIGESYVCCAREDLEEVGQLLEADIPAVESCLTPEKRGIKRALLEIISVGLARHPDAIQDYVRRTLLYHTMDVAALQAMVQRTIDDLLNCGMIMVAEGGSYGATLLGQAITAASLTPEDGLFIHADCQKALQAFVMDGEMHIFYMFTPIQSPNLGRINWPIFRREVEGLDESGLRVLSFCGASPAFINRMANSARELPETTQQEKDLARIYRRFYAALQLRDLCNEMPIHMVAKKYEMQRGFVQTLAQTCEGFAAGLIKFCERMKWGMFRAVLDHMSDRLKAGAKADLLELAQIPFVKSRTARVFWENGMKNVRAIAAAEPKDLVPILLLAQPKRSKINSDGEEKYHQKMTLKAEIIVTAASRLWEHLQQVDIEMDI